MRLRALSRLPRKLVYLPVVILAAACLLLFFRLDSSTPAARKETLVPHLARLLGVPPAVAARLSPGPSFAPFAATRTSALSFAGGERLLLEAAIERRLDQHLSVDSLHARGLLRLFEERFDEAVEDLAAARLLAPERTDLAVDLSAAYLAEFGRTSDPFVLLLATETAAQAFRQAPSVPAAAYNVALALDALHLLDGAGDAFEHYLTLDSSSEAADEARRRLTALRAPTLNEEWTELRDRLDSSPALDGLGFDLQDSPAVAFRLLTHTSEVLLPEWAAAVRDGQVNEAEARLARIREIGRALVAVSADETIARTVAAIESRDGVGSGASLAGETFVSWGEAMDAIGANDCPAAEDPLARAEEGLRVIGSPIADWAAYQRAVCAYFARIPAANERLWSLRESMLTQEAQLPMLLGRVEWMLGLTSTASGDWAAALPLYASAGERFRAAGDASGQAGLYAPITEAHKQLGESHAAWRTRLEGLAAVAALGEPKQRIRLLSECVPALLAEDRLVLAALFLEDFVREARRWEEGKNGLATALLARAHLSRRTGRPEAAAAALDEAERLRETIPPGPLSARLEADIQTERGLLQADLDPQEAAAILSEALDHFEETGYETRAPALLNARARAHVALGDILGAEADLESAFRMIEKRRETPNEEALRISYFETFQGAYDDMVRFHADRPGGARRAFVVSDLSRSRALLDRLGRLVGFRLGRGTSEGELGDATLVERLQAALPRDVAIVQYAVLPEALLTWIVRSDDFVLTSYEIPARELRRQVEVFESVLSHRLPDETLREQGSTLFTILVGHVREEIATAAEIVLVPDRFLARVPFAALYDPKAGRYLVQDFSLSLTPSARLLLSSPAAGRPANGERLRLLAVAGDAFDRERFPSLSALPGAEVETQTVAALYDDNEILAGPSATTSGFVAALPGRSVLHFAGHAVSDRRGQGSASLALAPGGIASRSGVLLVTDLESRLLSEMEVAFLSACSTFGMSARSEREGIEGIAREFLATGVPVVVASSQQVGDRPASELAVAFHRSLVAGTEPAAALRAAQLALLEGEDLGLRAPANWATFQLYRGSLQTVNGGKR